MLKNKKKLTQRYNTAKNTKVGEETTEEKILLVEQLMKEIISEVEEKAKTINKENKALSRMVKNSIEDFKQFSYNRWENHEDLTISKLKICKKLKL